MNCENVKVELLAKLKNEIPSDVREDIERHLAKCKNCRMEEEQIRKTLAATHCVEDYNPSQESWDRIENTVQCLIREEANKKKQAQAAQLKAMNEKSKAPVKEVIITILIIALLIITTFLAISEPSKPLGKTYSISGDVTAFHKKEKFVVKESMDIFPGTELTTLKGTMEFISSEKNTINIDNYSSVTFEADSHARISKGKILVDTKVSENTFTVASPFGITSITNGKAVIIVSQDRIRVESQYGKIYLENQGKKVLIDTGKYSEAQVNTPPSDPLNVIISKADLEISIKPDKDTFQLNEIVSCTVTILNPNEDKVNVHRYVDTFDDYTLRFTKPLSIQTPLRGTQVTEITKVNVGSQTNLFTLGKGESYQIKCVLNNLKPITEARKQRKDCVVSVQYNVERSEKMPDLTSSHCVSDPVTIKFSER